MAATNGCKHCGQPKMVEPGLVLTEKCFDVTMTLVFAKPICAICVYEATAKLAVRMIRNHIPKSQRRRG